MELHAVKAWYDHRYGMVTLEQSLVSHYSQGLITREQVLSKCQDPQAAEQLLTSAPAPRR